MSAVSVVATVEASNVPPRVRLDVTDTGAPNLFAATVTRLDPDGRTVTVRTADGNPLVLSTSGTDRIGLLYDYEMPYGQSVTYSTVETPGSSSAAVTVDSDRPWLIHPGVPALSQQIVIAAMGDRSYKAQRGVHYPMGRMGPVVQTDGIRKAAEYSLSVYTADDGARAALGVLLADAAPLLLNVPVGKGWGVTAEYVSIGDVSEARPVRMLVESARVWELPCTVVDRPAGGSTSQRNYVDVLVGNVSYTSLMPAYASYSDLLAGP